MARDTTTKTLRLPIVVMNEINYLCEKEGISSSAYIKFLIDRDLNRRRKNLNTNQKENPNQDIAIALATMLHIAGRQEKPSRDAIARKAEPILERLDNMFDSTISIRKFL